MLDKEKKVIDFLKDVVDIRSCSISDDISEDDINIILNLIEKQSKMINMMAECLVTSYHGKDWVIKYFEDEVELEENESK